MAFVYGLLYLLFTTLTEVFEGEYKFSPGSVGLTYLGIGIGCLLGVGIFGFASDKILKYMSAKGAMKPEYRLPPMIPGCKCSPVLKIDQTNTDFPYRSLLRPFWSLPLRLDSRTSRPLDCAHHRHLLRRHRPPRNLHAHPNLSSRCLHDLRGLCHRR